MSDVQIRGPIYGASGTPAPFTAGHSAGQRTQDAHARFMDAVLRGNVFMAANQAGAALSNLSGTCTGFALTNPAGSGKLIVLWRVGLMQTSTAATTANAGVQLAANINTVAAAVVHGTPLVVRNALLGSQIGVGLADGACTLPAAPVAIMNLWQPSVSATATTAIPPVIDINIDGAIVLQPGTAVSLSALSALSVAAHMIWEEISLNATP